SPLPLYFFGRSIRAGQRVARIFRAFLKRLDFGHFLGWYRSAGGMARVGRADPAFARFALGALARCRRRLSGGGRAQPVEAGMETGVAEVRPPRRRPSSCQERPTWSASSPWCSCSPLPAPPPPSP